LATNLSPLEVVSLRTTGRLAGSAPRAAQVPPTARFVDVVNERFVSRARARRVPVHVWTINQRPEMERLLDLGVDGIMTDECELLAEVMAERGDWPTS
jgi:glycerophosphoryl diester phosphodiesterase